MRMHAAIPVALICICCAFIAHAEDPRIVDVDLPLVGSEQQRSNMPIVTSGQIERQDDCVHCVLHQTQFRISVPEGATELRIELSSNIQDYEWIDLFLSYGQPSWEDLEGVKAQYASRLPGGWQIIWLSLDDEIIQSGDYYIAVGGSVEKGTRFELRILTSVAEPQVAPWRAQVGEYTTHCDSARGFFMERPMSWIEVPEVELSANDMAAFATPETAFLEGASIKVQRLPSETPTDLQQALDQSQSTMERMPGYVFIEASPTAISGASAFKYAFQMLSDMETLGTVVLAYWTDNIAEWIVQFTFYPSYLYAELSDVVDHVLGSIQLPSVCEE